MLFVCIHGHIYIRAISRVLVEFSHPLRVQIDVSRNFFFHEDSCLSFDCIVTKYFQLLDHDTCVDNHDVDDIVWHDGWSRLSRDFCLKTGTFGMWCNYTNVYSSCLCFSDNPPHSCPRYGMYHQCMYINLLMQIRMSAQERIINYKHFNWWLIARNILVVIVLPTSLLSVCTLY